MAKRKYYRNTVGYPTDTYYLTVDGKTDTFFALRNDDDFKEACWVVDAKQVRRLKREIKTNLYVEITSEEFNNHLTQVLNHLQNEQSTF